MEVRAGYKQTEVGVIPEDWEVKTFGEVFQFLSTASNPHSDLSEHGSVKYIHYGDVHARTTPFFDCENDGLPLIEANKVKNLPFLEDGDLVIVDASEDYAGLAKSIEVKNATGRNVVAGLHTLLLRGDKNKLSDGFKGYLQFIPAVKQAFIRIATGISVYGVSKNNVKDIKFPLPDVKEQTAIAVALSDTDALINSLGKLVAKKRNIKQEAMQQLLKGKKRLPGFTGEWEVKRMGEVGFFSKGRGLSKDSINVSDGLPAIPYTAIYTDFSEVIDYSRIKHFTKSACGTVIINTPYLLIASSSNMLENIGKATAFNNDFDVAVGGDIILYKTTANACFLSYLLSTRPHRKRIVSLSQGSTIRHVYASTFDNYEIAFPPLPEQTAIAQVISDMDAEIEALEKKLSKYRIIKQGMMQELLTGKKRLI